MQLKAPHAIDEFVNCYGSRDYNIEKNPTFITCIINKVSLTANIYLNPVLRGSKWDRVVAAGTVPL